MENKKKYRVGLIISKSNHGIFTLDIQDKNSGIRIARIEMDAATFTSAITSSYTEALAEFGALHFVGKVIETRKKSLLIEIDSEKYIPRNTLQDLFEEKANKELEEGWILDNYIARKGQVESVGNNFIIHYQVFRYVDEK